MSSRKSHGFTLVELVVTIPVFIISISVLIGFLVTLYSALLSKDARVHIALQSQLALSSIQDDLYFARNFAETASSAMVDDDAPGGSAANWNFNTSPNATLIVYEIALDKPRPDPNRAIVYQRTSASGNSCDPDDIELNPPLLNNLIYYIDSNANLRRRVLVPDPVHARCSTPYRIQSCATQTTREQQNEGGGTSVVACPEDNILASGVKSFTIDYFDADNNQIDISAGGSPLQAERITLKLTLERTMIASPMEHSSELTITKINGGDPDIQ